MSLSIKESQPLLPKTIDVFHYCVYEGSILLEDIHKIPIHMLNQGFVYPSKEEEIWGKKVYKECIENGEYHCLVHDNMLTFNTSKKELIIELTNKGYLPNV